MAIPNPKSNANPNTNPQPTIIPSYDLAPEDWDIPDNYVSYTLKTQKSLPPVSWSNYTSELDWPSILVLIGTPIIGLVGAWFTKLRWETALFSVFYYYFTGLGMSSLPSYKPAWFDLPQESLPDITASGLIAPTTPPSLSNTFSPWQAQVLSRAPSNGGLAVTARIIATRIQISTLTTPTRVFSGHIWDGWS